MADFDAEAGLDVVVALDAVVVACAATVFFGVSVVLTASTCWGVDSGDLAVYRTIIERGQLQR